MQKWAYLNGQWISADKAKVPATDWGFVQGVTVAEQLRTFQGRPFLADQHLNRLQQGLAYLGLEHLCVEHDLATVIDEAARRNQSANADDIGITVFVTPGTYPAYQLEVEESQRGPLVCVHTYSLPFERWCDAYADGVDLVSVGTQQIPDACWPADLKCRSRMHYYLAAREARSRRDGAVALLLNRDGTVSETPTSNVVALSREHGLVTPPHNHALSGVSLGYALQLAAELGIPHVTRPMELQELKEADEIWLTSTPYCMLPVSRLDDVSFAAPGDVFTRTVTRWSESVDLSIIGQANEIGASRKSNSESRD